MDISSRVGRMLLATVVATLMAIASALPASAAGVWDANDTEGRLDIRWVGMRYISDEEVIVTLVMYPSFGRRALPRRPFDRRRRLMVAGDTHKVGYYFRRHGHIRLSYGDHASGCCEVAAVRRPSRTTLVARIHPYHFGDLGDPGIQGWAESLFTIDEERHRDRTRVFRLPPR